MPFRRDVWRDIRPRPWELSYALANVCCGADGWARGIMQQVLTLIRNTKCQWLMLGDTRGNHSQNRDKIEARSELRDKDHGTEHGKGTVRGREAEKHSESDNSSDRDSLDCSRVFFKDPPLMNRRDSQSSSNLSSGTPW